MPKSDNEAFEKAITETAKVLSDGIQFRDLSVLLRKGIELADTFKDHSGPEKRELAIEFVKSLLDEYLTEDSQQLKEFIKGLDLPGPDWLEELAWDPLLLRIAPKVIKGVVLQAVPSLIDLLVSATRGEVAVNV